VCSGSTQYGENTVLQHQGLGEGSGVEFSLGTHSGKTLKGVLGH
jgi:hypothetical protein